MACALAGFRPGALRPAGFFLTLVGVGDGQGGRSRGQPAAWVALLALIVGLGYAVVSAYWAAGGRALLSTVGGAFVQAADQGGALVVTGVWLVVVVKVVAAVLPMAAVGSWSRPGHPSRGWERVVRLLAWADAVILTLYGLVLTAAGLMVQAGAIRPGSGADRRALAWHAYLWDPWFLVWGLLSLSALLLSRAGRGSADDLSRLT